MSKTPEVKRERHSEDAIQIFGWRVRAARTLRNLTAKSIVEKCPLSSATYSRIEKSDSYFINNEDLHALAWALSMPLGWFTSEPRAYLTQTDTHFRKNASMTKHGEETVHSHQQFLAEIVAALHEDVQLIPVTLPQCPALQFTPEEAAQRTREALNLSATTPIKHVIRSSERLGVFVSVIDFDTNLHLKNHDASSTWTSVSGDVSRPLMICRTHSSWERTRMSVAHELGHLVMHRSGGGPTKEEEAFHFAAELLFPKEALESDWPGEFATIAQIYELKTKWGMSISSLVMHAFRHGLITEERKVSLFKQLSSRKDPTTKVSWRKREPGADDRQVERPLLLANALEVGYGLPPKLDKFLDKLSPTYNHEFYIDFFYQLDCSWSRDLYASKKKENYEKQTLDSKIISVDFTSRSRAISL